MQEGEWFRAYARLGALGDGEGASQERARALAASGSPMVRDWAAFVSAASDRQFLPPR